MYLMDFGGVSNPWTTLDIAKLLMDEVLREIDRLVRRDPARRGIAAIEIAGRPLAADGLANAASSLATKAKGVAIATGFCVAGKAGPTAETDGPPGAIYLAQTLHALGIEVTLMTDSLASDALRIGCEHASLDPAIVVECPLEADDPDSPAHNSNEPGNHAMADDWVDGFLAGAVGQRLTHLIAIERAGPSHTLRSMLAQTRSGPPPRELFLEETAPTTRDRCLNMRGESIDGHTAKIHRLFESVATGSTAVVTIGIADGGNEIGCGSIPWEIIRETTPSGMGGEIACRIATDHTILAGVSNWGAYGLAAAVLHRRNRTQLMNAWDSDTERKRIEHLVHRGNLVDGVTRLPEPTVDGLPLETYLQTLSGIRRSLGLEP